MFFEGIEKKAEIYVDSEQINLLVECDGAFWQQMANACGAQIISSMSSVHCVAFVLSESSLFVWADKVLIVTCGSTELYKAVTYFLKALDNTFILRLVYQRKNEHVSSIQTSHFFDDIGQLGHYVDGKAYRFGQLHDHHNYLYYMDNTQTADTYPTVFQLLAYQLSPLCCEVFTGKSLDGAKIRQFLGLNDLLEGFMIDEHVFSPSGYSLNAIKGPWYLTIHITPITTASYISFEANFDLSDSVSDLLAVLRPAAFDLLGFNVADFAGQLQTQHWQPFVSKSLVKSCLSEKLMVHFASFVCPQHTFTEAVSLTCDDDLAVF